MTERINESILNAEIKEHLKENRTDHMNYLEDMEVFSWEKLPWEEKAKV